MTDEVVHEDMKEDLRRRHALDWDGDVWSCWCGFESTDDILANRHYFFHGMPYGEVPGWQRRVAEREYGV